MPFDNNLILIDGSVDYNPDNDTAPTSTTRDSNTGAAVIDLQGTGIRGLAVVLVFADSADANADEATIVLEASDESDFASDVHELGKFDIAAATKGVILGSEVPATVVMRFATMERYVRINGTVTAGDDFHTVYAYISPYPFHVL